jgi:hypothetical protein
MLSVTDDPAARHLVGPAPAALHPPLPERLPEIGAAVSCGLVVRRNVSVASLADDQRGRHDGDDHDGQPGEDGDG